MKNKLLATLIISIAGFIIISIVHSTHVSAATRTWDGSSSVDWLDPANWDVLPVAGDDLVFPNGPGGFTANLNCTFGSVTFQSITFQDEYSISCPTLFVSSNIDVLAGNTVDIDSDITAMTALFFNTSGIVTINGSLDMNGNSLIMNVSAFSLLEINSTITGSGSALNTTGNGEVHLAGTNSFTATINIMGGTTRVTDSSSLGDSANILNNTGGTLMVDGNSLLIPNAMFFSSGTTLASATSFNTISNDVDFNGTVTIDNIISSGIAFSGVVSGGTINKMGTGTTTFAGSSPNTFNGGFNIIDGNGVFAKPVGVNAIGGGNITIGNASNSAVLFLSANEQIPDSSSVEITQNATWSLNGNSETVDSITGVGEVIINAPGNTLTVGGTSTSFVFDGSFIGSGYINKTGNANVTFNGSTAYDMLFSILDGILIINGNMPAVNVVLSTGTLSGSGTVGGVSGTTGTITPGTPRVLTASTIDWGTGITYFAKVNGATQGTNYDYIHMTGATILNNPILSFFLGYAPILGDSYTILHADGGLTGNFAGLPNWALFTAGGTLFQINYTANDAIVTASAGYILFNPSFISSPNPKAGTTITITSTWTGTGPVPTGTAELFDGTTSLGSVSLVGGVATFSVSGLGAGAHSLTVEYSGSVGYGPATSNPLVLTVAAADPLASTGINLPVQLMAVGILLSLAGLILFRRNLK